MGKIIALAGRQNYGKSTTLNFLINLLSSVADSKEIYLNDDINNDNDARAYFKINGKWIFVGTDGDAAKNVRANVRETKKYDCEIGIIASRATGESAKTAKKSVTSDGEPITIVHKNDLEDSLPKSLSKGAKNRIIAAKLFQEIFEAIVPKLANEKLLED